MYHNHSLSDMLKEKQLEFNKHKQAIIYQRELDKIHAEEAWRAEEERRKQARIKAEKIERQNLSVEKRKNRAGKIAAEKKNKPEWNKKELRLKKTEETGIPKSHK